MHSKVVLTWMGSGPGYVWSGSLGEVKLCYSEMEISGGGETEEVVGRVILYPDICKFDAGISTYAGTKKEAKDTANAPEAEQQEPAGSQPDNSIDEAELKWAKKWACLLKAGALLKTCHGIRKDGKMARFGVEGAGKASKKFQSLRNGPSSVFHELGIPEAQRPTVQSPAPMGQRTARPRGSGR